MRTQRSDLSARIAAPLSPTDLDMRLARESSRRLAHLANRTRALRLSPAQLSPKELGSEPIELPAPAVRLLVQALSAMASGRTVILTPLDAELTTQQAADLLGVSRPFIVKQVTTNKIPSRRVGSHRRILYVDLMKYKDRIDATRQKVLDKLTAEAQKLKLGY